MTNPEVVRSSFRAMTDGELVARWARQQLTDEARPIAADELRARGIDPAAIDSDGELAREAQDASDFRRAQRQRAGRMTLRFVLMIVASALGTIGAIFAKVLL